MESQIKNTKYWEGRTSVEEERILKNNHKNENPKNMEQFYFAEIENRKSIESTRQFSIPKRKTISIWKISSVAATIAILLAFALNYGDFNKKDQFLVEDPQQAYEISQQALMFVSAQLNKGKTYTAQMDKINEVKQIINK